MTKRRIIYLGVMFGVMLLAFYFGHRPFYIVFISMAAMMLLSVLYTLLLLLIFKYTQRAEPASAVKGDNASLIIDVHNDFILPLPNIKVYYYSLDRAVGGAEKEITVAVSPMDHAEINHPMQCDYRGVYKVGMDRVTAMDPLGLFSFTVPMRWFSYYREQQIKIYPKIVPLARLPLPLRPEEGQSSGSRMQADDLTSLSDLRTYQFGDPLRRIHWKLSARKRELMVKLYEETAQPDTLMFLDCAKSTGDPVMKIRVEDKLIECVTAVTSYLLGQWLPLRMIAYGEEYFELYGQSPKDFAAFYDYFAEMEFDSPYKLEDIMLMQTGPAARTGSVMVFTHKMTDPMFNALNALKAGGVSVFAIVVSGEGEEDNRRMESELTNRGIRALVLSPDDAIKERMEAIR